jgi:hypothetical protein
MFSSLLNPLFEAVRKVFQNIVAFAIALVHTRSELGEFRIAKFLDFSLRPS